MTTERASRDGVRSLKLLFGGQHPAFGDFARPSERSSEASPGEYARASELLRPEAEPGFANWTRLLPDRMKDASKCAVPPSRIRPGASDEGWDASHWLPVWDHLALVSDWRRTYLVYARTPESARGHTPLIAAADLTNFDRSVVSAAAELCMEQVLACLRTTTTGAFLDAIEAGRPALGAIAVVRQDWPATLARLLDHPDLGPERRGAAVAVGAMEAASRGKRAFALKDFELGEDGESARRASPTTRHTAFRVRVPLAADRPADSLVSWGMTARLICGSRRQSVVVAVSLGGRFVDIVFGGDLARVELEGLLESGARRPCEGESASSGTLDSAEDRVVLRRLEQRASAVPPAGRWVDYPGT